MKPGSEIGKIIEHFNKRTAKPGYIPQPLDEKHYQIKDAGRKLTVNLKIRFSQWSILLSRNLRVSLRDRSNLILLFGQVPVIALLLICAFWSYLNDERRYDDFARTIYYFDTLKAPYEKAGQAVPVDRLIKEAGEKARKETLLISEPTARQRGSVTFLLVASCIWFGIIGACCEVVTEKHILERESRSCIYLCPYLLAKMAMMVLVTGLQTILLAFLVVPMLLQLPLIPMLHLWLVLWVTAISAAALGLLISCLSRTLRFALTAVPLLLIPQLVFGGFLRPPVQLLAGPVPVRMISDGISAMAIQRWAFEAALVGDVCMQHCVLSQEIMAKSADTLSRYAELNVIRFNRISIVNLFFNPRASGYTVIPWIWLAAWTILYLLGAYIVLRFRYTRG